MHNVAVISLVKSDCKNPIIQISMIQIALLSETPCIAKTRSQKIVLTF